MAYSSDALSSLLRRKRQYEAMGGTMTSAQTEGAVRGVLSTEAERELQASRIATEKALREQGLAIDKERLGLYGEQIESERELGERRLSMEEEQASDANTAGYLQSGLSLLGTKVGQEAIGWVGKKIFPSTITTPTAGTGVSGTPAGASYLNLGETAVSPALTTGAGAGAAVSPALMGPAAAPAAFSAGISGLPAGSSYLTGTAIPAGTAGAGVGAGAGTAGAGAAGAGTAGATALGSIATGVGMVTGVWGVGSLIASAMGMVMGGGGDVYEYPPEARSLFNAKTREFKSQYGLTEGMSKYWEWRHSPEAKEIKEKYPPKIIKEEGGTVICTELHRQKFITTKTLKVIAKYKKDNIDKATYDGYMKWAPQLVKLMQKSKLVTMIIKPFGVGWINEMAHRVKPEYKGSLIGKILLDIGISLCRRLGKEEKHGKLWSCFGFGNPSSIK